MKTYDFSYLLKTIYRYFIPLLLFTLLVSSAHAQQSWQETRKQYLKFAGDTTKMDSALKYAYKLKEIALNQYGKKSNEYYRSLNSIGFCEYQLKQYNQAKNTWLTLYKLVKGKTDTVFNQVKRDVTLDLYSPFYMDYRKQADSSYFFAREYLKAEEKINGKISRKQLNEICHVANKFEGSFANKYSDSLFAESLKIREQLFGTESVLVTWQLDSVLHLYSPPNHLARLRFALYSITEQRYSYKQLDSLERNAKAANELWAYFAYSGGKKDEALVEFPDSLKRYAYALQGLAVTYHDFRLDSVASFCLKRAFQTIAKSEGRTSEDYADALSEMGYIFKESKDFEKSKRYYELALSGYATASGKTADRYAGCLLNIAEVYGKMSSVSFYSDNYQQATHLFKEAVSIEESKHGKTSLQYEAALQELGINYFEHARLDEADTIFNECWKIYQVHYGDSANLDKWYLSRQLYQVYAYKDQVSKAIPWVERCISIRKTLKDTSSTAYVYDMSFLFSRYLDVGDTAAAKLVLNKIDRLSENFERTSADYLNLISMKIEMETNVVKKDSLLDLRIETDLPLEDTTTSEGANNIAGLYGDAAYRYMTDKNFDKAYRYSLIQLSYLRKFNLDTSAAASDSYQNIATYFAYKSHQPDSANKYFDKALSTIVKESAKEFLGLANQQLSAACFYWYNNQTDLAEKMMTTACSRLKGQMLLNMAGLSEAEKQNYNKALQQSIQKYYNFHGRVYRARSNSDTVAYNYAIQSKGLLLNTGNQLKNEIAESRDTVQKNKYEKLVAAKKQLAKAYTFSKEQQTAMHISVADLESQSTALEEQLSAASPAYSHFQTQNRLKFEDIRKSLKPGEAAIEFIAFPYFYQTEFTDSVIYAAFIIKANSEKPVYIPLTNDAAIKPFIQNQGAAGRGAKIEGPKTTEEIRPFKKLYKLIWQPLSPYLSNVKRIYLSTDGLLNKVAFASLQDASGKYLIDRYELRFLLNTRDVVNERTTMFKPGNLTCALFGGANFDAVLATAPDSLADRGSLSKNLGGNSSWPDLPYTLSEVKSIASILKAHQWTVSSDTGSQASETCFEALSGYRSPAIIHIATHGFYFPQKRRSDVSTGGTSDVYRDSDNPLMRAGLVLAGANRASIGAATREADDDGILTAYEMANLDLTHTQLVVLSACETGAGEVMNGEGVFGLQRALRQAGVKNMIVSLWPVDDKVTAEMMQEFYSNLVVSNNISLAFNSAQAKMRAKFPNQPALWAGFTLIE